MRRKKKREPIVVWDVLRDRKDGGVDVCTSWTGYSAAVRDSVERDDAAGEDDLHRVQKRVIKCD